MKDESREQSHKYPLAGADTACAEHWEAPGNWGTCASPPLLSPATAAPCPAWSYLLLPQPKRTGQLPPPTPQRLPFQYSDVG
jgi:hypothetical protein